MLNLLLQFIIWTSVLATVIIYYRQLKTMQCQLQTAMESHTRSFHSQLLLSSMTDQDILKVWNADHHNMSSQEFKQHLFVNLHLSHIETLFHLGKISEQEVEIEINHHKANPFYKKFWANARDHRSAFINLSENKKERLFHEVCEKAFKTE